MLEGTAERLDANANTTEIAWKATDLIGDHGNRKVFTISGGTTATNFSGRLSDLPTDIQAALKPQSRPEASRIPDDSRFVDYLRGKDPVTDAQGALFRQRPSKMGAIVNAPPIDMGDSRDFAYDLGSTVSGKETYEAFIKAKRALPASMFVATNAGVMHALDAKSGQELAAFMPRRSLRRMLNYAKTDYSFEYTLDGPLSEHDIYDGSNWNHIAMGSGGRGEQLLYAVRSPLNSSPVPNRVPEQRDFLWESGPDRINDGDLTMGYITNPIRSGQTASGDWVAVINSGHLNGTSDGSKHGLVILNAMTGAKIRSIPLPKGYSTGSTLEGKTNGLGGVTLMRDANKRIVAAYAGDANGNLWRFDLKGPPSSWAVSYNKPLFTTAKNRPIYGSPAWQPHPQGGTMVVVATGILLSDADLGNPAANEAIYGIWDPTPIGKEDIASFAPVAVEQLLQQTVLQDTAIAVGNDTLFNASKNAIDWKSHRGWTVPLGRTHKGERSLDQIRNVGRSVLINTTVLTASSNADEETCTAAALPPNFMYALNALDGASMRFFMGKRDGKTVYGSVLLVGEGGYSRGIKLVRKSYQWTPGERKYRAMDSQSGEASPTPQACRAESGDVLGTGNSARDFNIECGWSRTQYQLSRPPSN